MKDGLTFAFWFVVTALFAVVGVVVLGMTAVFAGIALFGTGALGGVDPPPSYAGAAMVVAVGVATQWLLRKARRFVRRKLGWIA